MGHRAAPHNAPNSAFPQSPFSALALRKTKEKMRAQGTQKSPRKLAAATDCARETRLPAAAGRPQPRTATPTAVPIVPGPFPCAVEEGDAR